ncbi:hypothetical protein [Streptomyces albogriseolus]|uniref:Uncharacterized protein n=1 Tax=Streptomyces albogriseolus TaxID=1887 RepID=A0ACC6UK72_STRAO|nr:hypothetical protein GCM10018777_20040 [Streptomyces viridodiastaticus]
MPPSRNVDVAAGSSERDAYREHRTRPLGKPLTLPEPFEFDLDTADFL